MNDRPQRNDRSDRDPRERNNRGDQRGAGGQRGGYDRNARGDRNDRPQRDERGARAQRGEYDRSERPKRDFDRSDRPQRSSSGRDERPQRSNYSRDERGAQGQRGGYDRGDRPQRSGYGRDDRRPQRDDRGSREQRGGYDRNDRPQRSNYGRDERPDRPSYGRDEQRPARSGYGRDDRGGPGQRGGYDRGDRPQRSGYGRDDQRPQRGEYKRDDQRPQRDGRAGREQRGGYDRNDRPHRPFDRNDRPQRDDRGGRDQRSGGDRPQRDDRPRRDFERGDRNDRSQRDGGPPERRDFDRGDRGPREQRGSAASYGRGGTRGDNRSDRGGRDREFSEAERLQHELRPVRASHQDPIIPDEVEPRDLHPAARNELKTLQADIQERVARHLAMVAFLIEEDPELAHQHALSASRRAGRIPVTRETLAITAYRTGDFALALRELRTYRRLSGLDNHVALMVDCERGLGRPERAIETGLAADASKLDTEQRVHLAIAMSGARLDLGQTQQALFELEIPELNPAKAFSWSSHLFGAYAAVLEDLGRTSDAAVWTARSEQAANAVQDHVGALDELEVFEIYETELAEPEELEVSESDPVAAAAAATDIALEDPEFSIEDEVDELLAEAGVSDGPDDEVSEQNGIERETK